MRWIAHPAATEPPGVDDCLAHRCLAHREIFSRPEDACPICDMESIGQWRGSFLTIMEQWARDAIEPADLVARLEDLFQSMLPDVPASDRPEAVPHARGVSAPLLSTVTTPNEPTPGLREVQSVWATRAEADALWPARLPPTPGGG